MINVYRTGKYVFKTTVGVRWIETCCNDNSYYRFVFVVRRLYSLHVHECVYICVHYMYMSACIFVFISCTWVRVYLCSFHVHEYVYICVHYMYMNACIFVFISCTWVRVYLWDIFQEEMPRLFYFRTD